MFRLALRNTLARKARVIGTALSVMLGVAFLAGTLVFSDTIKRTFDDLFANVYAKTDSMVRSSTKIETGMGTVTRGRIPMSVVDRVRAVEGVARAEPQIGGYAQVVGKNGKVVGDPGRGAPTFGMSWTSGALGPWQLTRGSRPPGPNELVVDLATAKKAGLRVGDVVTVLTQTGPHRFPLVGITRFGSADSADGASFALWDLTTAQRVLLGRSDEVDTIAVAAAPGVSQAEVSARLNAALPNGIEAVTGKQITRETQNQIRKTMGFFDTFLLVFVVIALIVASFTIYNTFQILVTQRRREMALLRAVGATAHQVLASQLVEAFVVGVLASLAGVAAGLLVATLLKSMLAALGVAIPATGMVFRSRTLVVGLVVGTFVTTVSAVLPSLRASHVRPLEALRDVTFEAAESGARRTVEGVIVTLTGTGAMVAGLAGAGILWVGIGAFAMLLGAFVLAPVLTRPFVHLVGAPLPHASGVIGELAEQNALRNPKRTARTGGALMVGVALVAAIMIIAASAKAWMHDVFDEQFSGDFVVATTAQGFGGLSPKLADQIAKLPEVRTATGIRIGMAKVRHTGAGGTQQSQDMYVAVDPASAAKVFDIGLRQGTLATLTPHGVLLSKGPANTMQATIGDTVNFTFPNGTTHALEVEGIYERDELAGKFVISHAAHEQSGADQFDFSIYIAKRPGVSDAQLRAAVEPLTDSYPNAKLQSRSEYVHDQAAQVDQLANLMYGLLGLAVVIALFSIANSMALSIHERTRELGLLRAVGMTRHQTRVLVRWEAVLVSLLGASLGLLLGGFFGWSISVTLRGRGLTTFAFPVLSLVIALLLAVLGGVFAARRPARRAAKLDVLRAIAAH